MLYALSTDQPTALSKSSADQPGRGRRRLLAGFRTGRKQTEPAHGSAEHSPSGAFREGTILRQEMAEAWAGQTDSTGDRNTGRPQQCDISSGLGRLRDSAVNTADHVDFDRYGDLATELNCRS